MSKQEIEMKKIQAWQSLRMAAMQVAEHVHAQDKTIEPLKEQADKLKIEIGVIQMRLREKNEKLSAVGVQLMAALEPLIPKDLRE